MAMSEKEFSEEIDNLNILLKRIKDLEELINKKYLEKLKILRDEVEDKLEKLNAMNM